jgi:hypothetical protein
VTAAGDNRVELSVVLPVERFDTIREVVSHLRAQTAADRLELVLVAPSEAQLGLEDGAVEGLAAVRTIETGKPLHYLFRDRAAGIRAARAPLVALAETHCFPDPGWAEAMIEAHRGPWAGVGPAFANANPGVLSWANLVLEYGPWLEPVAAGATDNLPGHNSSYKRENLLPFGDELEEMLEAEYVMHREMRSRGLGLLLEPAARTRHLNVSRPLMAIVQRFRSGRAFGTARSRRWSRLHRLLRVAAGPLIPLVRLPRAWRDLRRAAGPGLAFRVLPALAVALIVDAAGETVAYAIGGGVEAQRRMQSMDLERDAYIAARDTRALVGGARSLPTARG